MIARRIVVVGAGIIGATTAHALRADGHDVTLLEAAAQAASVCSHANGGFHSAAFCAPWAMPGLPRQAAMALLDRNAPFRWRPDGSLEQLRWMKQLLSHCTSSEFSKHRARMVRLALLSRACFKEVVAQTDMTFDWHQRGVLLIFRNALPPQVISQRLAEMRGFGIHASWCDRDEVFNLEPKLLKSAQVGGALFVRHDSSGDCERFVQSLIAWNVDRGLKFERNTRIDTLELEQSGSRLRAISSSEKRWEADAFVFAIGVAVTGLLRRYLRVPVLPVKGYSVTANIADTSGPTHAVIDEASKLAIARLGSRARLAGMAEIVGHDRSVNLARCQQLVGQYEALYGSLPDIERSYWSGLRPMTPDGTPIIGATAIQGLYLNTGHGAYGWTLSCGSASLLADQLAGRASPLNANDYALDPAVRA